MAIYHCTTKTINRSLGRSAVASSAYRAGEKIKDERTGLVHDFTKKGGVLHSELISALDTDIDRNELWNLAEQIENRKDARTAREWIIALPDELSRYQQRGLAKAFAQSFVDRYGVVADLAIHEPSKGGDDRNYHAHIMLSTRKAYLDEQGKLNLGEKTEIELSNAKRKTLGLGTTQNEIKEIRQLWADLANRALEHAGSLERIDHRSYEEQGNGLQPTIHEGNKVTQLRRQGVDTEISRFNDDVKQYNEKIKHLEPSQRNSAIHGIERANQGLKRWMQQKEDDRQEQERQNELQRQLEREQRQAEREQQSQSYTPDRGRFER